MRSPLPATLATLASFATLALLPSLHSQTLISGFESPEYNTDNGAADVAGQNGWTIDDTTPDLSFFVVFGYAGSDPGNNGAAIGGYLDSPVEPRVELANTYGGPLVNSLTTMNFAVQASTNDFPGSDVFGFTLRNTESAALFSLALEPNPAFSDRLEVVWYDGANVRTSTGYDLFYGSNYDLALTITGSGPDAAFSAVINGATPLPFNGLLGGSGGATLGSFGAYVSRDTAATEYGDNYLVFDNLNIQPVPEPAVASLALAGLLGLTLRRRR